MRRVVMARMAWDGLTPGPQAGTYYGKFALHYGGAVGRWGCSSAVIPTRPLEKLDWQQEVGAATGEVEIR